MDQFKIEALQGRKEGWRILKLSGAFTLNAIFEFQLATRTNPEPVTIVDLTDVPYMDSAALGSLLGFSWGPLPIAITICAGRRLRSGPNPVQCFPRG